MTLTVIRFQLACLTRNERRILSFLILLAFKSVLLPKKALKLDYEDYEKLDYEKCLQIY